MIGLAIVSQSQGLLIGAIFMNHLPIAVFLCPISCIPLIIFCGYMMRVKNMHWLVRPLTYQSYLKFAFESCLLVIYGFDRCEYDYELAETAPTEKPQWFEILKMVFTPVESSMEENDFDGVDHVGNLLNTIEGELNSPLASSSGYQSIVLNQFDIDKWTLLIDIIGLFVAFVLLRVLAYVILLMKINKKE